MGLKGGAGKVKKTIEKRPTQEDRMTSAKTLLAESADQVKQFAALGCAVAEQCREKLRLLMSDHTNNNQSFKAKLKTMDMATLLKVHAALNSSNNASHAMEKLSQVEGFFKQEFDIIEKEKKKMMLLKDCMTQTLEFIIKTEHPAGSGSGIGFKHINAMVTQIMEEKASASSSSSTQAKVAQKVLGAFLPFPPLCPTSVAQNFLGELFPS